LKPIKLTYNVLIEECRTAEKNYIHGDWNVENMKSYLMTFAIGPDCIDGLVEQAKRQHLLESLPSLHHDDEAFVLEDLEANPDKYAPYELPALWNRGVLFEQHFDVIMHLIFLGIVKKTMDMVVDWAKARSSNAPFERSVTDRLESVHKLRLNWCKVMPYSTGRGGWVSENYLGFSRLIPWFYLTLWEVQPQEYVPPERPYEKWNMKENKAWLQPRQIQFDKKINAQELKDLVHKLMNQVGSPPPILPPAGGTLLEMMEMLSALNTMISVIMVTEVTDKEVNTADFYIKYFLSCYAKMDRELYPTQAKPTWITSYNFPSLLNIPDAMKKLGPLRNLWEGSVRGEGFIKYIKPEHGSLGLRQGWQERMLKKILQKKALSVICPHKTTEDIDIGATDSSFNKYLKQSTIKAALKKGEPMSILQKKDGSFGIVLKQNFYTMQWTMERSFTSGAFPFMKWTVSFLECEPATEVLPDHILRSCILLPYTLASVGEPLFSCISDDWMVFHGEGGFAIPKCIMGPN
jgi:hypothetical protein